MTVQSTKQDDSKHLQFYTVAETASILRLSRKSVYDLIKAHSLPAIRLGKRQLRISSKDLKNYIDQKRVVPIPEEQSEASQ